MITPADWNYLLIGSLLSVLTQAARIYSGESVPLSRVVFSSCVIAGVAAFSLNGLLIIWMSVPPLASMFIGGLVGFAGGEWVLAKMVQKGAEQLGESDEEMKKMFKTLMEHIVEDPMKAQSDE